MVSSFLPTDFLLTKSIFPLLYTIWVYCYLNNSTKLKKWHICIITVLQTLLWILFMERIGFRIASQYTFILLGIPFMAFILKQINFPVIKSIFKSRAIYYVFISGYIIGCIIIGYIHPFNRFSMFNKFSNSAFVIMLRGDDNQIIPISSYCGISENGLFEIYNAIRNTNDYKNDSSKEQNETIGREMFKCMKLKIKKPLDINSDSLSIYKITYLVKDGKIVESEKKIYTQQIE